MEEFNQKGFPIIKLHDDCFEIKAIDYWEYRTFKYSEVIEIDYYSNKDKWWNSLSLLSNFEPYKLKIIKENGADWVYDAPRKYSAEFALIVKVLIERCGLDSLR